VAGLGLGRVSFGKYYRFILPLVALILVVILVVLLVGVVL